MAKTSWDSRCAPRLICRFLAAAPGSIKNHLNTEELARITIASLTAGGGLFGLIQALALNVGSIFPASGRRRAGDGRPDDDPRSPPPTRPGPGRSRRTRVGRAPSAPRRSAGRPQGRRIERPTRPCGIVVPEARDASRRDAAARAGRRRPEAQARGEDRDGDFEKPKPSEAVPLDLLPVIRESGVLTDRQFADIKAKVLTGDYPSDSVALAERLVRETSSPSTRPSGSSSNKSHGLRRRPLRDPRPARLGLDGAGLQGPSPDDGPGRRPQDHRPGDRLQRAGRRPVPARDEAGRPARPPQRGPGLRRRPDQQGPLHRDGVRPGPEPGRAARGRG